MRSTFTFLLLFLTFFIYAQEDSDFPELIPPSPQAAAITKYGDVPANASLGLITPSISLYNFSTGKINIPVSLNYGGNGVRVDDAATWTGMNWTLNAGGAVTRVVKDLDDLTSVGQREFYTSTELNTLLNSGKTGREAIKNHVRSGQIDSEVDLFHFSFPGYSGGFYLDENYEPHLTKYSSELRIEILNFPSYTSQTKILITTPNGTKYKFGGPTATESTKALYPAMLGGLTQAAPTSYYLYEIEHPTGDAVILEYDNVGSYTIYVGQSESQTTEIRRPGDVTTYEVPNQSSGSAPALIGNQTFDGRFLKRIYSQNDPDNFIEFNKTPASTSSYKYILTGISIGNKANNEYLKHIDFSYLYPGGYQSGERFFLEEVIFNNKDRSRILNTYDFEYNDIAALPPRFSFKQDYLGYFNNQFNTTLLPETNDPDFNYLSNLADRSPNFIYASKGALTRINYPTGGYSKFEYESPKTNSFILDESNIYLNVYQNDPYENPSTTLSQTTVFGDVESVESELIYADLNVTTSEMVTYQNTVNVHLTDVTTNETVTRSVLLDNGVNTGSSYLYQKTLDFYLEGGHEYQLELELAPHSTAVNVQMNASLTFPFKYYANSLVDGPGIRLKRQTDETDGQQIIKRYYYTSLENAGQDEAVHVYKPTYVTEGLRTFLVNVSTLSDFPEPVEIGVKTLSASNVGNMFLNNDKKVTYDKVTVSYGGDNFEQGGKEMTFKTLENKYPSPYLYTSSTMNSMLNVTDNSSVPTGTLQKEMIVQKKNNNLYKVEERLMDYNMNSSEFIINNTGKIEYEVYYEPPSNLNGVYLALYPIYSFDFNLVKETSISYKGLVGLNDAATTFNSITTETIYEYNTYHGLPSKISSINSTGKEEIKEMHYADDVITIQSLGLDDLTNTEKSTIDGMKRNTGHIISTPLQTTSTVKTSSGTILAKDITRNIFKDYNGDILLGINQTSKNGSALKDQVVFHRYDARGNPLEVSKKDGPSVIYLWGYQDQFPIAKIENATYAEVASNLGQSVTSLEINIDEADMGLINSLRSDLSNAKVTTYTYEPLIGIKTITDPKGYTTTYEYDEFNRLKQIRDQDNNILKEHSYKYKQ